MNRIVFVLAFALLGCPPPSANCTPRAMRCTGRVVEICSTSQRWEVVADCARVTPVDLRWTCCERGSDRVCLPATACEARDE